MAGMASDPGSIPGASTIYLLETIRIRFAPGRRLQAVSNELRAP